MDFPASGVGRQPQVSLRARPPTSPNHLFGASLRRHRLHGLEFVAADEIHAREHPFQLFAQPRLDLALKARKRAESPGGNAGDVVKKPVLALHRLISAAAV
jgi:hypothetical protein